MGRLRRQANSTQNVSRSRQQTLSNLLSLKNKKLDRRTAFKLSGALLLVVSFAIAGMVMRQNDAQAAADLQADKQTSIESQSASTTNDQKPASSSAATVDGTTSNVDASVSGNVSTSIVSNTDSNGQVTTQVTVNGQEVAVPDNGSTTINTPTGQVNLNVTSNNDSSDAFSHSHTSVFSSSSSINITNGGN